MKATNFKYLGCTKWPSLKSPKQHFVEITCKYWFKGDEIRKLCSIGSPASCWIFLDNGEMASSTLEDYLRNMCWASMAEKEFEALNES